MVLFYLVSSFHLLATDYYINDNDLTSDVYCTAVGNAGNDGLTASTPKSTLRNVIDTYGPSGTGVIGSGDRFYVDAGEYFQTDLLYGLNISDIQIIGAGSLLTLFDNGPCGSCSNEYFATITANDIEFHGFTLTGYAGQTGSAGKAITVSGATGVVFDDIALIGNGDNGDGALLITSNSEVDFLNGRSSCNQTNFGGGINIEGQNIDVYIFNSEISNNEKTVAANGGGLRIEGLTGSTDITVLIENSIISNNKARMGGGIEIQNADVTIRNSCISNNSMESSSSDQGGGIYVKDNVLLELNQCSLEDNFTISSADGGAIGVEGENSTVTIQQCYFSGNSAGDKGNAIFANGSGGNVSVIVNESIFETSGPAQSSYATSGDGFISITNSGNRMPEGSPVTGDDNTQTLGMPTTNCPINSTPCQLTILPVEFLDFTIACQGEQTQFNWSTASERNNDYFTLKYSADFINWGEVHREKGMGTTQLRTDYSIALRNVRSGYYKLSQVDIDGKVNELKTVFSGNCGNYSTIDAYYNQSNNSINISYAFNKNEDVELAIVSSTGQVINSVNSTFSKNENTFEFGLPNNVAPGLYFVMVRSAVENKTVKVRIN